MFNFKMNQAGGTDGGGATGGNTSGGAGGQSVQALNIADGGANTNGQGAAQQSMGGGGSGSGDGGANGKSWLETLPEDIKGDPSLAVFKDVNGLAKSYVNAQKMLGADKVILPNDKSTEEEWNAFYQKLGRPESADKYEIKAPDGKQLDENVTKSFREAAFKLGLSPKQVAGLAEWNHGTIAETQKAGEAAKINELRSSLQTYQDKLGGEDKYKARVDDARVAVNALAKPEFKEFLKKSGMGSHPDAIEFFAELKSMMSEDKIRDGTGMPLGVADPAAIQSEIKALEEKMFANLNSSSRMDWVEQRNKLYERLSAARQGA